VLVTIQETGVPFGIVSRVARRLGIATESLRAQGRAGPGVLSIRHDSCGSNHAAAQR
jgi:hypothetical protein